MMYRLTPIHHHDQGSFTTDKVDEKLEERINRERLGILVNKYLLEKS